MGHGDCELADVDIIGDGGGGEAVRGVVAQSVERGESVDVYVRWVDGDEDWRWSLSPS